jgi:hypothetical protein
MNTVEFLTKNNFTGCLSEKKRLFNEFNQYGIKVSYRINLENNNIRYIFSTTKKYRVSGRIDRYISECNGLVLEASNGIWSVLVLPVPTFKSRIPAAKINVFLEENLYDVIKIRDGTIINMYYYEGEWCISTARGLLVNEVSPKNKTYQELLSDVCKDYKTFTSSLDIKKSYTFGFKHPEMHPFYEGKETSIYDMWFIQSYDQITKIVNYENTFAELGLKYKFVNSPEYGVCKNIHNIFKKNTNSMVEFALKGEVNYGFILRSRAPLRTLGNSNILLESKLLQNIRKLKYKKRFLPGSKKAIVNDDRLTTLNGFLDTNVSRTYLRLFPNERKNFEILSDITNNLAKEIITISNKTTKPLGEGVDKEIRLISELLYSKILEKLTMKLNEEEHLEMLKLFIRNTKNVNLFNIVYNTI